MPCEARWTRRAEDRRAALGIVMASAGYPDEPRKVMASTGLPKIEDAHVFHAGSTMKDGQPSPRGGRVLCVTALGDSVKQAQSRAYQIAEGIQFEGSQMRRDIGWRAIKG